MTRYLSLAFLGGLLAASTLFAQRAEAMPLPQVITAIQDAGGHYVRGAASLTAADCSGLVSVAQSLATGQAPHRLGNTTSLLNGQWPNAIRGASPEDVFIIAANRGHMVAQINGVGLEATTSGRPFLVGAPASSVWAPQFPARFHVDPAVLVLA